MTDVSEAGSNTRRAQLSSPVPNAFENMRADILSKHSAVSSSATAARHRWRLSAGNHANWRDECEWMEPQVR